MYVATASLPERQFHPISDAASVQRVSRGGPAFGGTDIDKDSADADRIEREFEQDRTERWAGF
jgi:hypothetical protein